MAKTKHVAALALGAVAIGAGDVRGVLTRRQWAGDARQRRGSAPAPETGASLFAHCLALDAVQLRSAAVLAHVERARRLIRVPLTNLALTCSMMSVASVMLLIG